MLVSQFSFAQLKDIKILIPKENLFSMTDNTAFTPDSKYFFTLGNSLSVFNTETAEMVDEFELGMSAKCLQVSSNGTQVLALVNTDLYLFSFQSLQLKLISKINTTTFIAGETNSQYYGMLPVNAAFFTHDPSVIYVGIGSYTLLYDLKANKVVSRHTFPPTDYVLHAQYNSIRNEAILAKTSGTINTILRQSLNDLTKITVFTEQRNTSYRIKVKDSVLFSFNTDAVFSYDLITGKILHEVAAPKFKYEKSDQNQWTNALNKRVAVSKYDVINFEPDEFIYDISLLKGGRVAVFSTVKGLKFIDIRSGKLIRKMNLMALNTCVSNSGDRLVTMGHSNFKGVRVYEPNEMKLISERKAMGNAFTFVNISPENKWLYTGSGSSGHIWDLSNYSKYCEIKDPSESDSSYVQNAFFLSDSEIVVNSGHAARTVNLSLYNIKRKKYTAILKKGITAWSSGFMNGEFYYSDLKSLHIVDLKTMKEEKYDGMFSLAASQMYHVIDFNSEQVFIPDAGKFKIVNRKTGKTDYESETWMVSSRVSLSKDGKSVFTLGQIKKKHNFSGTEMEIPTQALVRIDLNRKAVINDYAQTYIMYDFKIREEEKILGVWYVKYELGKSNDSLKEHVYTVYEIESGKELFTTVLARTPDHIPMNCASEKGKYFSLYDLYGNYFKIFNAKGEELIDLKDMKLSNAKCFFIEERDLLIVTGALNPLATFVDLKNKKVIGQMANASADDYFMLSSDLKYCGSKEFVKNIRFKLKSEIFSFDQFDAYLNQPHQVLRSFGCTDSLLIKAYETAYLKRMKVLGLNANTELNFSEVPKIDKVVMKEEANGKVNFLFSANKGKEVLSEFIVTNNGTLIHSEIPKGNEQNRMEKSLSFETSSGMNQFEFIVKDRSGKESPRITRFFNNTSEKKPDLYLLVIASEKFKNTDFNLNYAVKDAGDVANTMVNSKAFNKIYTRKMINLDFQTDSVKKMKKFFEKAGVNDLVMIFYAGHGFLDTDLSYYFPTYYTDFSDPKINSVAYTEFEKLFSGMNSIRKLMFIDACFSGEVDTEVIPGNEEKGKAKKDSSRKAGSVLFTQSTALEMSKAVFTDLRQHSGVTVISSAGGTEAAWEAEAWKNGLFTYCMLSGMKDLKADLNKNGKVTLNELQKFVSEEVNRLSDGEQTPTYRVENTILDYELW